MPKAHSLDALNTVAAKPAAQHDATEWKPLDLPAIGYPEDGQMFAVRLKGQEGYWPAFAEQREVTLVDPDKPWVYPTRKPGERHPMSMYEQPFPNVITDEDGAPVKITVRAWRRADDRNVLYYEHPGAVAATRERCQVVEVVPWCPMVYHDAGGFLAPHGQFYGQDDPSRFNKTPGKCPVCERNRDEIHDEDRAKRIVRVKKGY